MLIRQVILLAFCGLTVSVTYAANEFPHSSQTLHHADFGSSRCTHPLYCNETVLEAVTFHGIYKDSKYFVDQPTRIPLDQLMSLMADNDVLQNASRLSQVLQDSLLPAGADLAFHAPSDHLTIRSSLSDTNLSKWIQWLHTQWKLLTRVFNGTAVCSDGCTTSALDLPNPFVVPGGRFVESYYWDTFWIVKGLLASKMFHTVDGLLDNFRWLIEKNGFIPNGNRVYYFNRSQPPVFAWMLMDYVHAVMQQRPARGDQSTDMVEYIKSYIPHLHNEYAFWMTRRNLSLTLRDDGQNFIGQLNRYQVADNDSPRPESFSEDFLRAQSLNLTEQSRFYAAIAAGAESGWDFSSRWFRNATSPLADIHTDNVIPVDLNSLMHGFEIILAALHGSLDCVSSDSSRNLLDCLSDAKQGAFEPPELSSNTHNFDTSLRTITSLQQYNLANVHLNSSQLQVFFSRQAQVRRRLMQSYLWNADCLVFTDYYIDLNSQRKCSSSDLNGSQYASSFSVYWTRAFDVKIDGIPENLPARIASASTGIVVQDILTGFQYLSKSFIETWPGGIPTSHYRTGQQWDFPNAWPPLQWIAIEALQVSYTLDRYASQQSISSWSSVAVSLLTRWLRSGFCGWQRYQNAGNSSSLHRRLFSPDDYYEHIQASHAKRSLVPTNTSSPRAGGMFEKYDAAKIGYPGGGGEYVVQDGFGWTNGVIIDFFNRFSGQSLVSIQTPKSGPQYLSVKNVYGALNWLDDAEWQNVIGEGVQEWFFSNGLNCTNIDSDLNSNSITKHDTGSGETLAAFGIVLLALMTTLIVSGIAYAAYMARKGSRMEGTEPDEFSASGWVLSGSAPSDTDNMSDLEGDFVDSEGAGSIGMKSWKPSKGYERLDGNV